MRIGSVEYFHPGFYYFIFELFEKGQTSWTKCVLGKLVPLKSHFHKKGHISWTKRVLGKLVPFKSHFHKKKLDKGHISWARFGKASSFKVSFSQIFLDKTCFGKASSSKVSFSQMFIFGERPDFLDEMCLGKLFPLKSHFHSFCFVQRPDFLDKMCFGKASSFKASFSQMFFLLSQTPAQSQRCSGLARPQPGRHPSRPNQLTATS